MEKPKRIYFSLSGLIILLFFATAISTLSDYGMSWDEQVRWRSGDLKLEYYKSVFQGIPNFPTEKLAGDRYPGLYDLPLAVWHSTLGGNRMIQGHILSICFGTLGLISTTLLAGILFGAKTAFWSTLILALLPKFYGHSMINPKDIPFLASYTLGLFMILWITKKSLKDGSLKTFHFLLCGIAIGMAGSTRIPGLVLLPIAVTCWIAAIAWRYFLEGKPAKISKLLPRWVPGIILTVMISWIVVLAFFPRSHFQVFSSLPEVTSSLHSSAREMPLLFNGLVMEAGNGPFAYAHRFFIISTPIWLIALLAVGVGLIINRLIKDYTDKPTRLLQSLFLGIAAFPWIYILVSQPDLHDGIRHMLFAIPPLIIIMGYALDWIVKILDQQVVWTRFAGWLVIILAFAGLIANLVRMHPYQYVSFNALAGERSTIPNRFDTEYWCTSTKHLLEALPTVVQPVNQEIPIRVSGALDAAQPFVPEGFRLVDSFEEAFYYVSNTNFRIDLIAEGEVVFEIRRGGIPIGVIKRLRNEGLAENSEP